MFYSIAGLDLYASRFVERSIRMQERLLGDIDRLINGLKKAKTPGGKSAVVLRMKTTFRQLKSGNRDIAQGKLRPAILAAFGNRAEEVLEDTCRVK